ncbi:hypothetical protein DFP73DRAFT_66933 [Morchella snyderi]|nr:hypothetical protein DFP73DRAFT_66933 [Morchella snyderi]
MSLSNDTVSLGCSDNISIATTSTTTSTPIEKEGDLIVVPPKSSSLSPSPPPPPSPPPSPLLPSQPEEKQQPILDPENPLSSPEHPDGQPEETGQQADNKGRGGEQTEQAEQHETDSNKSSSATESPLGALKPKEHVISFDFQDAPLIADDEVDDDEGEYDLSGKNLEEEMAQMARIRGRDREPLPGTKRVLKRVRVRKDTSSSKRRTKKHNLRATMNSAVIAEKLAAERSERSERSGRKEMRREKKERLAAVVEWKPIVEPVSKPRARPSGLRFSENCYSDPEDDEGQVSEPTGHKRKREGNDLGDEDDETLGESADRYGVPEKRQHQSHAEFST